MFLEGLGWKIVWKSLNPKGDGVHEIVFDGVGLSLLPRLEYLFVGLGFVEDPLAIS